jgi:hypothetical protein
MPGTLLWVPFSVPGTSKYPLAGYSLAFAGAGGYNASHDASLGIVVVERDLTGSKLCGCFPP